MANQGFGGANDFEALSRQYWTAWGDAMRAASGQPAMPPGMQGWQDAVDWWSQLAQGGQGIQGQANDVVERFGAQARHWFGQMQQVAAQFAGQQGNAHDIANAWKQALGAAGENPFPEIFRSLRGQGQHGLDQWIQEARPYLDALRREGMSWLSMPAFGLNREHTERLQALARAQVAYQDTSNAFNAVMAKAGQRAFDVFEAKLAEREEPGRQIASARALFDLWIDAAEDAYAEVALSPEYRSAYGALVNAQMRLRSGIQKEVELAGAQFGMPTRTEMDAAHRKIAELERMLRRMRDAAAPAAAPRAAARAAATSKPKARPGASAKAKPAPAAARPPPRKVAKKTAKKAVAKRVVRAVAKPATKRAPAGFAGISSPVAPDAPASKRKPAKGARR